jgi:23S rRNA (cytidine1920-2'-O)/16S rRNA (cytidine1409-2'-O)-methyltransferase
VPPAAKTLFEKRVLDSQKLFIMKNKRHRLDVEAVARGLVESVEKARALIMAGDVLVNGQVVYKADTKVTEDQVLQIKEKFPYASRGALKIEKAFEEFGIDLSGIKALDIGISTGGFSDYMLKKGAEIVAGVDVNIQQVDHQLKQHPRLKLIKANARHLTREQVGFEPGLITMDVSFISITKVLPALSQFKEARILSLVKPQFEAKPNEVDKGGIVRDPLTRIQVLLRLKQRLEELNYAVTGFTAAGVKGRKGNREYFFLLEYGKKTCINDKMVADAIESEF